jgi:AcrR family transcriptional regulator
MPPKGERRRQQIVNTAKQMFMDKGFQSTHIGQVCEKLNIARGTVYQYFRNKKEILFAIIDVVLEKMGDIFDQEDFNEFFSGDPTSEHILEFINKRLSSCISVLLSEPIVIKLIFKEIVGVDEEVNERINNSIISIEKMVTSEVEELMKKGIFKHNLMPEVVATLVVGGVLLVIYEYNKRKKNALDANLIENISKYHLHGVLK